MTSVHPVKLAYRGVLIERPCANCDTVNIHFEGRCDDKCLNCGGSFYYHDDHGCAAPTYNTYYPADIEWPTQCSRCGVEQREHCNEGCDLPCWSGTGEHHLFVESAAQKSFHAILDKARELGEPTMYTSDLFRDYQKLMPGKRGTWVGRVWPKFAWKLRAHSCGSDLYFPDEPIRYTNRGDRFFLFDGTTHGPLGDFPEVDLQTAQTILATWRALDFDTTYSRPVTA